MAYKIYQYTFPNGKVYIGKTKTSIEQRAGVNGCRYGDNTLVGRAIRKYGWVNVVKEILFDNLSEKEANRLERETIKNFKATNRAFGYNLTRGGDGGAVVGHKVSEETRRKIGEKNRASLKGRVVPKEQVERMRKTLTGHVVTQETREKLRQANLGKKHTEETKKKISEANRNRSPEVREKIKESLKKSQAQRTTKRAQTIKARYPNGIPVTPEHRKKLSDALRGRPKSEETRQRMRKPKSPEHIEHMREAQKISREARKLGMTYKEYITKFATT